MELIAKAVPVAMDGFPADAKVWKNPMVTDVAPATMTDRETWDVGVVKKRMA